MSHLPWVWYITALQLVKNLGTYKFAIDFLFKETLFQIISGLNKIEVASEVLIGAF